MKRSRPPFGTSAGFRPPSSLAGSRVGSFRGVGRSDLMASAARSSSTPGQVTSSAAVISRSRHYLSRSQEHLADDPTASSRRVPARPKSSLGLATAVAPRKTSSSSNASSTSAKDGGCREKNVPARENGGSKDKTVTTKENTKEKSVAAKETAAKTDASKEKLPKERTKSDSSSRRLSKDKTGASKSRPSDKRVQPVAPTRVSSGRDNEVTTRPVASRIDMDVLKEELRQVRLLLERQVEQGPATSGEERNSVHETLVKMIEQLQQQNQTISQELTGLRGENRLLRERLSALGLSLDQKTDAEKELLLLQQGATGAEASSMMSVVEGAPAAPGGPLSASSSSPGSMEDLLQGDVEANLSGGRSDTPDNLSQDSGDLLGSGSMPDCTTGSEVSMVDLQERIIAMEENQQSVSEELEATIQELTEQQMTVEEISSENEQLQKENAVIMESLRQQTERLEQSRAEVDELKTLLAQKQPKLEKSTSTSHLSAPASPIIGEAMRRVRRSSSSSSERGKDGQATASADAATIPSDIPESQDVIDSAIGNAQVEAERAKSRCAELERSLGKKSRELARLEDRVQKLEADRTCANDDIRDLKFQLDHMTAEVRMKDDEISGLRESAEELERTAQSHVSEKRQDSILISELQGAIKNLKQQKGDLEQELTNAQRQRETDAEEWRQFQADLQTAVVIANDMRTEAQEELLQLKKDYNELKQRLHSVHASPGSSGETTPKQKDPQIQGRVQDYLASVEKDLSALRQGAGVKRPDNASPINVKNLVKSFNVASQSPPSPTATVPPAQVSPLTLHGVTLREKNPASTANPQWRHSQPNPSLPRLLEDETDSPQGKVTSPGGEGGRRSSVPSIPELEALQNVPEAPPSSKDQTAGSQPAVGPESRSPVARGILKKKEVARTVPVPAAPANNNDRRDSTSVRDPLAALVKRERGGSKRNALLKWCQRKTQGYTGIDVTNFSTSWNDGLSFCALLHSYLPEKVPFSELTAQNKRKNFTTAFQAAESVGIPTFLSVDELVQTERPDWQAIMAYVTSIYAKFENV
ncbi:cytospin-A-like isoform X2 [Branchiostoma lanceolatum]|uniref:cytospin-A-like isoform X2 n=1 Tax=Branchiostoma lanceolatum TaxID=7740 RepID=UPI003453E3DF